MTAKTTTKSTKSVTAEAKRANAAAIAEAKKVLDQVADEHKKLTAKITELQKEKEAIELAIFENDPLADTMRLDELEEELGHNSPIMKRLERLETFSLPTAKQQLVRHELAYLAQDGVDSLAGQYSTYLDAVADAEKRIAEAAADIRLFRVECGRAGVAG